jgi:hypothetical protein|tara:strand:- start:259 stop:375 length:117 start_codon:yes stop_codon:yes gene_type:complete
MLKQLEDIQVFLEDVAVGDKFITPARTITDADSAHGAG